MTPTVQSETPRTCGTDPRASSSGLLDRMTPAEWRRRLLHILPGFLPVILWFKYHRDPLSADCRAWLALIIAGIGIATAIRYRSIARRGERSNPACILGYTLPVFLLLMLVPAHAELGLTVLAVLAVGDGFATLGGILLSGPSLPWNREKTWAGFLCFLVFSGPWSAMVYWAESRPAVPFDLALQCGFITTICAAVAESIRSRLDDNVRVGIAASISILLCHAAFVGFSITF